MEDNEIMNYEAMEAIDGDIVTGEKRGLGTGVAMLIGAGVTLAVTAGFKLLKNRIKKAKAKREAEQYETVEDDDQSE